MPPHCDDDQPQAPSLSSSSSTAHRSSAAPRGQAMRGQAMPGLKGSASAATPKTCERDASDSEMRADGGGLTKCATCVLRLLKAQTSCARAWRVSMGGHGHIASGPARRGRAPRPHRRGAHLWLKNASCRARRSAAGSSRHARVRRALTTQLSFACRSSFVYTNFRPAYGPAHGVHCAPAAGASSNAVNLPRSYVM